MAQQPPPTNLFKNGSNVNRTDRDGGVTLILDGEKNVIRDVVVNGGSRLLLLLFLLLLSTTDCPHINDLLIYFKYCPE